MNITKQVGNCKFNNEWFGRNQSLNAITSLLFSGVCLWSKSVIKGLFSKLKSINIQHHGPEKYEYIGHAVNPVWLLPRSKPLETRNWEISNFNEFKTTENEIRLGKYVLNDHPTRNSK